MEIYKQPSYSVEERVRDLLSRMTLREKTGQLNQRMYGWDAYAWENGELVLTEAFRREVAEGAGMGALYGLFRSDPWSGVDYSNGITAAASAAAANKVQRYVLEHTRLGIPVLLSEECPHGHQALDGTLLPVNLAAGATWNPQLMEQTYSRVALELRSRGLTSGCCPPWIFCKIRAGAVPRNATARTRSWRLPSRHRLCAGCREQRRKSWIHQTRLQ